MIVILSHRRTGTHLLIDSLRVNFKYIPDYYISVKELLITYDSADLIIKEIDVLREQHGENIIVKCHLPRLGLDNISQTILSYLLSDTRNRFIILSRQMGDVFCSMFDCDCTNEILDFDSLVSFANRKSEGFPDINISVYDYYRLYFSSWSHLANVSLIRVKFEDLINDFTNCLYLRNRFLFKKY